MGFSILLSNQVLAQFGIGLFSSHDTVERTCIVDIVAGSAQKDNNLSYVTSDISIPASTIITWFNDDPSQPHTVSSGLSISSDKGKELIQA